MKGGKGVKLPLNYPWFDQDELNEIISVLRSGWVAKGPKCKELEGMVVEYLGERGVTEKEFLYCVAVSSCTAALHLALMAYDIGRGDEVIVPDFTFPATAMAVMYVGARPVFADVLWDTYCIDPEEIRKAITPRTKAIIPVHLFGHPAEMDTINRIAAEYGLTVIEDAACALGAKYRDGMAGTWGDVACFSLHGRKVITTGEGGLLVTTDQEIANYARRMSQFGIAGAWERSRGEFSVPEFEALGWNFKMSDIQAAVGVAQMRKLDRLVEYRTELAKKWDGILSGTGAKLPKAVGDVRHTWQNYMAVFDYNDRNDFIKEMREKGVESGIGTFSCLEQPLFRAYERRECPRSRDLFYRGVSMPMAWGITVKQI